MKDELKTKLNYYDWDIDEIKEVFGQYVVDQIYDCDEEYVYLKTALGKLKMNTEGQIVWK